MQYSIIINQVKAVEWDLDAKEAIVFSFLTTVPVWAKAVPNSTGVWFWISKSKVMQELPLLKVKGGSIYRLMKGLEEKGLIELHGEKAVGKTLMRLTKKADEWRSQVCMMKNDDDASQNMNGTIIKNDEESVYQYPYTSNQKHITSIPAEVDHQQPKNEIEQDMFGGDDRGTNDKVCPWEEILDIWAEVMPDKPQPSKNLWPDTARARDLSNRWKACFSIKHEVTGKPFYTDKASGLDWWRRFFTYLRKSDFLMGNTAAVGQRAFTLKIDWIVKKGNFVKILENTYHR